MLSKPCIVVAGMGRCGTSLMMQMLDATGVPCVGKWPDYETDASLIGRFDAAAFAALSGRAIKLIDPANLPIGDMPNHIVVWLDREPRQQAKSQIKLLSLHFQIPNRRQAIRTFEGGLKRDRAKHKAAVGVPGGGPGISVRFEALLSDTHQALASLLLFLSAHGWAGLDQSAMARQVRSRSADCYSGFLEAEMIGERREVA